MTKHLKNRHKIDPARSSVARKREVEGVDVLAALKRSSEVNIDIERRRRNELLAIGLDKSTLEYLFIRWITETNLPWNTVTHTPFRSFLEYVNPSVNSLLPNSPNTFKAHAIRLFEEGKKRLRAILGSAVSEIHISCDAWTSPNYLSALAIVARKRDRRSDKDVGTG